ncbi:MAG: oligoribonuclease [Actinobacteria bacterium]|nr:oligoribonuclease [Actinomycetota bacterium]
MADRATDRLVWVDCEMTGLDLGKDQLVEVAVIVTESDLTELDSGLNIIIRPADLAVLDSMDEVVREMHAASGLLEEIPNGVTLAEAEEKILDYVRQFVPDSRKAPLAGSSVYVDRGFLARDMPALDSHLHYRVVDVSSIKEMARRWYPRAYFASPEKRGNHRALGDIRESIAELRYYRDAIFVPLPGPDTESARATAAGHVVDHG